MAIQKQRQIRYIKEGDLRNSPGANRATLIGGALFSASTKIVSLKAGCMVGFGFFINDTPSPIRILRNGNLYQTSQDESASIYALHETYEFPSDVIKLSPIYNIKCEAASIDRLNEWNQNNSQEEWLIIDYVEEVNL